MSHITVDSSLVATLEYFEDEEVLEIYLHNNHTVYCYLGFPVEIYEAFMASDSKGRFYNSQIRGYYAMVRNYRE